MDGATRDCRAVNARIVLLSVCCSLSLLAQGCFLDRSPLPGPSGDAGLDAGRVVDGGSMDAQVPVPDGGPSDGGRDGGLPDTGVLDAGCGAIAPSCDGDQRLVCIDGVIIPEICELGCTSGVCRRLVPSNVGEAVRMDAGSRALTGTALVFNTDTGRITDGEAEVRAEGEGVLADIAYVQVAGAGDGAPGLGVFVVGSLNLPMDTTHRAEGGRAFVLLVAGDANIAGTIDVSSDGVEGGPGGSNGGGGPGRGGNGQNADLTYTDSGAGGGGFGTAGGLGGPSGDRTPGAAGGTYGNDALIPLFGGSGGGRGGNGRDGSGGAGGGGGGAIQISVGGTLTISGVIDAGGAGGAGGRLQALDAGAGGGGGSGGAILLEGLQVVVSGRLAVNGGGGGEGGRCSACCGFDCGSRAASGEPGDAYTVPAGGTGSSDSGGAGGTGSGVDGIPGAGGEAQNGGGGGGGAGRIRINARTVGAVSISGTIYPAHTAGEVDIRP